MRRILVCGSRYWTDWTPIQRMLSGQASAYERQVTVVHGGAGGADAIAGAVARTLDLGEEPHFADWKGKGRGAGPARNREMLDSGVHEVWAFKDDFDWSLTRGGTENMVRIANTAGVPVYVVQGLRP